MLYPSPLFPSRAAFWPLLAGFEARQPLLNPWQGQGRKKKPTTETTSRTTAPTSRGPRRWGGNPATPNASSGHPPTRKTDFLLALTFSARHAALLVVLAVQLALVVVVGAAHATAPVVGLWWVPGLAPCPRQYTRSPNICDGRSACYGRRSEDEVTRRMSAILGEYSPAGQGCTRHFSVPPLEYKNLTSYKKYRPEFGLNILESRNSRFKK